MFSRRLYLLGLGALLIFALSFYLELDSYVDELVAAADRRPVLGSLLFIGLYVASCIFLLPGFLLTAAAGFGFGLLKGFLLVSTSATLGAGAAFLISRYVFRSWVTEYIADHPKVRALDKAVGREATKIVLLTRLCPIIPFRLSNYVFGATSVPFRTFILTTWMGTIPSAFVYVYLGSLAGSLQELYHRSPEPWEWAVYGGSALLLVYGLSYISRLAEQAINEELEAEHRHSDSSSPEGSESPADEPLRGAGPKNAAPRRSVSAARSNGAVDSGGEHAASNEQTLRRASAKSKHGVF